MTASKLKRISHHTDAKVTAIAHHEGRTFVAQLDRIVDAGVEALGLTHALQPPSSPQEQPQAEVEGETTPDPAEPVVSATQDAEPAPQPDAEPEDDTAATDTPTPELADA